MKKGGKIPRIDEPVIVREKTVPNFTKTKCEISDNFRDVKKLNFNCSAVHSEEREIKQNLKRKTFEEKVQERRGEDLALNRNKSLKK